MQQAPLAMLFLCCTGSCGGGTALSFATAAVPAAGRRHQPSRLHPGRRPEDPGQEGGRVPGHPGLTKKGREKCSE